MNYRPRRAGFSLIELLVVIAIIGILAGLIMPSLGKSMRQAKRVQCMNNLRQIGIAFQQFADLNQNRYPMNLPSVLPLTNRVPDQVDFLILTVQPFQEVAPELASTRLLVCAADSKRTPADSFGNLTAQQISYRLSTNAAPGNANTIVATDRNVTRVARVEERHDPQGQLEFDSGIHDRRGNVLMGDGRLEWIGGFAWQRVPLAAQPDRELQPNLPGQRPRPPTQSDSKGSSATPVEGVAFTRANGVVLRKDAGAAGPDEPETVALPSTNEIAEALQRPAAVPFVISLLPPQTSRPGQKSNWWWLLVVLAVLAYWYLRGRGGGHRGISRMAEFYTGAAINTEAMLATLEENGIAVREEFVHAELREHDNENNRATRIYVDKENLERANALFSTDPQE
jgi:prepilin-type N-terminal cleavage/methylation domain-containing protein